MTGRQAFGEAPLAVLESIPDRVAERLREAILAGRLRPGMRVNESEIADAYQISRTPIREALRALQQEGLVVVRPRRGAFVRTLTPEETIEVYAVKGMAEGFAAHLAAQRMTGEALGRLGEHLRRLERAAEQRARTRYVEVVRTLHVEIVEGSGNATLVDLYHTLDRRIHWLRSLSIARPGRLDVSLEYNRTIVEALRRRDADGVERLVRTHQARTGQEMAEYLRQLGGFAAREPIVTRSRRRRDDRDMQAKGR